jgi:tRNA(Ile)-lysidine synthase
VETFTARVGAAIRRQELIRPGERVVVAVSGGPDSLALLHALVILAPELSCGLHVAHLDHGLRGAAGADDAAFVAAQAARLGLECTLGRAQVAERAERERLSVEDAARRERFAFLRRVAAERGAAKIALGHTRDDQAETFLLRLVRGAGTLGLGAMAPARADGVIRPLLGLSRAQVEEFCRAAGLEPRRDPTNRDPAFLRNRIRAELLPLLETYNPRIREVLSRIAEDLRFDEEFLGATAREARAAHVGPADGGRELDLEGLPEALRRRLLRLAAQSLGGDAFHRHVAELLGDGDAAVMLPGEIRAVRRGARVRLIPPGEPVAPAPWSCPLPVPGRVATPAGAVVEADLLAGAAGRRAAREEASLRRTFFDYDRLPGELAVRSRRPGDRLRPRGMAGTVKLQDLLVARKVPREQRDGVPLVVAGEEILWVVGHRVGALCPVDPTTRRVLRLRLS